MEPTPPILEELCRPERGVDRGTLEQVVSLAIEIAREGREGRKVGTMFVVGDTERVLASSQPMILDPLLGHPDSSKRIQSPDVRETIKELAQLDGGFVVSNEGVVISGARFFSAPSEKIAMPLGLGSRHLAAAAITRHTHAVAVVVSESSVVRLFDDGEMVSEILPEIWMLHHGLRLGGPATWKRTEGDLTVVSKREKDSPPT